MCKHYQWSSQSRFPAHGLIFVPNFQTRPTIAPTIGQLVADRTPWGLLHVAHDIGYQPGCGRLQGMQLPDDVLVVFRVLVLTHFERCLHLVEGNFKAHDVLHLLLHRHRQRIEGHRAKGRSK